MKYPAGSLENFAWISKTIIKNNHLLIAASKLCLSLQKTGIVISSGKSRWLPHKLNIENVLIKKLLQKVESVVYHLVTIQFLSIKAVFEVCMYVMHCIACNVKIGKKIPDQLIYTQKTNLLKDNSVMKQQNLPIA